MAIKLSCFSHRGTGKAHNEDALLPDDQVHHGRVREHGEVDASQSRYFAVANGVFSGTVPCTGTRRLSRPCTHTAGARIDWGRNMGSTARRTKTAQHHPHKTLDRLATNLNAVSS